MSRKSVAQKLFIKEDYRILVLNEPKGYRSTLGGLPPNVTELTELDESLDLIQVFAVTRKELEEQLPKLKRLLKPKGLLWVTYPKGTSKIARAGKVDINRDSIWKLVEPLGMRPVAMISIDETWSAMRLKIVP